MQLTKSITYKTQTRPFTFDLYDETIRIMFLDSSNGMVLGCKTINELEQKKDEHMVEYFLTDPVFFYCMDIIDGGRLDLFLRLPLHLKNHLEKMKMLEVLFTKLATADVNDLEWLDTFTSLDQIYSFIEGG